ncbi:hypothetical protein [Salibacterium halotolerans]|nr:hypothetical protein [Salibacterium halotolerans]
MKVGQYRLPLGSYEIGWHVLEPGRHVSTWIRLVQEILRRIWV